MGKRVHILNFLQNVLGVRQSPNIGLNVVHEIQDILDDPCVVDVMVVVESQFVNDEIYSEKISHPERIYGRDCHKNILSQHSWIKIFF